MNAAVRNRAGGGSLHRRCAGAPPRTVRSTRPRGWAPGCSRPRWPAGGASGPGQPASRFPHRRPGGPPGSASGPPRISTVRRASPPHRHPDRTPRARRGLPAGAPRAHRPRAAARRGLVGVERGVEVNDTGLLANGPRLCVSLAHVDAFDNELARLGDHSIDNTLAALVTPGEHLDGVALAQAKAACLGHAQSTSGARTGRSPVRSTPKTSSVRPWIEAPSRLGAVNVLGDRAHATARDRHVARGLETLRGVDDGSAGYQEVSM